VIDKRVTLGFNGKIYSNALHPKLLHFYAMSKVATTKPQYPAINPTAQSDSAVKEPNTKNLWETKRNLTSLGREFIHRIPKKSEHFI
jgi:hypothetical protein